ncbi:MAG: hypothetical protein J5501_01955 [Ruminococcus sp.]|nr:hypothetical protein [Ruminococcus sp.]
MKYDIQKRDKALKVLFFRAVVAGYLGYLGFSIATEKNTAMNTAAAWALGILFMAVCAGFAVYSIRRFLTDMSAAKLTDADVSGEEE